MAMVLRGVVVAASFEMNLFFLWAMTAVARLIGEIGIMSDDVIIQRRIIDHEMVW